MKTTQEQFKRKIENGSEFYYSYKKCGVRGGINIWKYEGQIILTWEEFHEEDYYNENKYLKDVREFFANVDEVIGYLSSCQLNIENFRVN